MAKARREEQWDHTSALMALIANAELKPRRPFLSTDFHPMRRTRRPSIAEAIAAYGPTDGAGYVPVSLRVTQASGPDTQQEQTT